MIEFTVKDIIKTSKTNDYTKLLVKISNEEAEKELICDMYYNFHIGNKYKAEEVEKKDIKPNGKEKIISNISPVGVDKKVLDYAIKKMGDYLNESDIKELINLCDFKDIANNVINKGFKEKNHIIDKIFYYKNMDKLIKFKDKHDLDDKVIGYYLSKDFKKDIVKDLENKPYKLIGFGAKEELIKNLFKDENDMNLYNLLKIIYTNSNDGNVYCTIKFLRENSNIKFINIWYYLNILSNEKIVKVKKDKIYLRQNYELQQALISNLVKRLKVKNSRLSKNHIKIVKNIAENSKFKLEKEQKASIYLAMVKNISVITGGAGTGKSFTIGKIIQIVKTINPNASVSTLAFAGKAVNRLNQELINSKAQTIHRFLQIKKDECYKQVFYPNIDYLIIDEASMIGLELFSYLLNSVPIETKILICGDVNQLQPVGLGNVFMDIIDSNKISVTKLNKNMRQEEDGIIDKNAKSILESKYKKIEYVDEEFKFCKCKKDEISKKLLKQISELTKKGYGLSDISILTVTNLNALGTQEINKKINDEFVKGFKINEQFSVGNKVIHTMNNYSLKAYNGEVGIITEIEADNENCKIIVNYGDREVEYNRYDIKQLKLAYGLTIYKMQGSSNKVIVLIVDKKEKEKLNKNLIYVAITRATENFIAIGDKATFDECVSKLPNKKSSDILDALLVS